ncbi:hypothetical protein LINGRAHAP2_LOCUS24818 [Linum grandiflorum]
MDQTSSEIISVFMRTSTFKNSFFDNLFPLLSISSHLFSFHHLSYASLNHFPLDQPLLIIISFNSHSSFPHILYELSIGDLVPAIWHCHHWNSQAQSFQRGIPPAMCKETAYLPTCQDLKLRTP